MYIGERIWGSRFQNSPLDLSVDLLTRRFKRGYLASEQVPNVLVLYRVSLQGAKIRRGRRMISRERTSVFISFV